MVSASSNSQFLFLSPLTFYVPFSLHQSLSLQQRHIFLTPYMLPFYHCPCPSWNWFKLWFSAQKENNTLPPLPSDGLLFFRCVLNLHSKWKRSHLYDEKTDHSLLLSFWILIFIVSNFYNLRLNLHFGFLQRHSSYPKMCCFRSQD